MTRPVVLLDTGPLVAALSRNDRAHSWAKSQFAALPAPFLTCEPVISEACFLLRQHRGGASGVLALVESGALRLGMSLAEEATAVRKLFDRYYNIPASLADVCLVRMAEIYDRCLVLIAGFRISISAVAMGLNRYLCRGRTRFSAEGRLSILYFTDMSA